MSGSVNKAILIGRLGRDPEARTFPSGGRVVSFSLATDETWRDKATGERKQRTQWHNVTIFNEPIGKIAEQYLKKGASVYLEGQIETREYTDKEGVQRKATEIVLRPFNGALVLMGDGGRREAPNPDSYGTTTSRDAAPQGGPPAGRTTGNDIDDDIPFAPEVR